MKIAASLAAMCPSVQRRRPRLPFLLLLRRLRLQRLALPSLLLRRLWLQRLALPSPSLRRLLLLRVQLSLRLLPLPFKPPRRRLSWPRALLRRPLSPPLHLSLRKLHRLSQSLLPRQQRLPPKPRSLRKHPRSPPRRMATTSSR